MPTIKDLITKAGTDDALGGVGASAWFATVAAPAPASTSGQLWVVIPDMGLDQTFKWGPCNWSSNIVPNVGDPCLVTFDNRQQLWAMLATPMSGGGADVDTPPPVTSVFTRTGAIVAQAGDYTVAQVTGAAPLASPAFTGTPNAPTPAAGDNSSTLATTAFVKAQGYLTSVTYPVTSVFGRTGAVVQVTGDYTAAQVTNAFDLSNTGKQTAQGSVQVNGGVGAPSQNATVVTGAIALPGSNSVRVTTSDGSTITNMTGGVVSSMFMYMLNGTGSPMVFASGGTGQGTIRTSFTLGAGLTMIWYYDTNAGTAGQWTAYAIANGGPCQATSVFGRVGVIVAATGDYTVAQVTGAAPLASPAFTGTPTAPTAAGSTNTTQVATTAFVMGQLSSLTPVMDGAATAGTAQVFARGDHVHPTDTSRAPLASPTFTGTPAAPTAAVNTNTTQIATTAFVIGQAYAPLASPALTGTPTAPTAAPGTNTTQLATTAFVAAAVAAVVTAPTGAVIPYAGSAAPSGWLICDGSAVSRTTYAALFTAISTTYGAGDGSTTFNLPNLQGNVPVGKTASGTFGTLGATGGETTHTLVVAEMPSHSHANTAAFTGTAVTSGTESATHTHSVTAAGSVSSSFAGSAMAAHSHIVANSSPPVKYNNTVTLSSSGLGISDIGNLTGSGSSLNISPSTQAVSAGTPAGSVSSTFTGSAVTSGTQSANHTHSVTAAGTVAMTNASAGSDGAHNNLQPYIVLLYIIKT